jgi:hypothetical protein
VYNKDYGIEYTNTTIFNIAIPFKYVNIPNLNSSFTDIFIKIMTTVICYLKKKVYDTKQCIYMFKKYILVNLDK